MDLLIIQNNARKLAAAIHSLKRIEEKLPPFLIKHIAEIYKKDLNELNEFLKPRKAVTFCQQIECVIRQAWQIPYEKIFTIHHILQRELFRLSPDERENVIALLKTIFLRSHGNPFEITWRLLTLEPVREEEILMINDIRFDFDVRIKIIDRLFSARNEMTSLYASEFIKFISSLNDSYRKEERERILELVKKTSSLPYPDMLSFTLKRLTDNSDLQPQGVGAVKLAFISFQEKALEKILSERLWETHPSFCQNVINSPWIYKEEVVQRFMELYDQNIPCDLKIAVLEGLKHFYKSPQSQSCNYLIQEFVMQKQESEIEQTCLQALHSFDEKIDSKDIIIEFLKTPDNWTLQKRLRRNADYAVPKLLEIVKEPGRNYKERNAALFGLSKINHRWHKQTITKEVFTLLRENKQPFTSIHYRMFDCIKADCHGLKEYLLNLAQSDRIDEKMKKKVMTIWDRVFPDSPRPGEKTKRR